MYCCLEIWNFSLLLCRVYWYGWFFIYKCFVIYLFLFLKDLVSLGRFWNELIWKIGFLEGLLIIIFGMLIVMCLLIVNRKIFMLLFWSFLVREVVCFVLFKVMFFVIINKIWWIGFVVFLVGECIFDLM